MRPLLALSAVLMIAACNSLAPASAPVGQSLRQALEAQTLPRGGRDGLLPTAREMRGSMEGDRGTRAEPMPAPTTSLGSTGAAGGAAQGGR